MPNCITCQNPTTLFSENHWYFESGLSNVVLKGIQTYKCRSNSCQKVFHEDIPRKEELDIFIGFLLTLRPHEFRPEEVNFIVKQMRYSIDELSRKIPITLSRPSSQQAEEFKEKIPVNPMSDLLLRELYLDENWDVINSLATPFHILQPIIEKLPLCENPGMCTLEEAPPPTEYDLVSAYFVLLKPNGLTFDEADFLAENIELPGHSTLPDKQELLALKKRAPGNFLPIEIDSRCREALHAVLSEKVNLLPDQEPFQKPKELTSPERKKFFLNLIKKNYNCRYPLIACKRPDLEINMAMWNAT